MAPSATNVHAIEAQEPRSLLHTHWSIAFDGSPWAPSDPSNAIDQWVCKSDLGSWASIAWTLVALGALLLLSGLLLLVAHATAPARQAQVAPPPARAVSSVGTELAELARLRDAGR